MVRQKLKIALRSILVGVEPNLATYFQDLTTSIRISTSLVQLLYQCARLSLMLSGLLIHTMKILPSRISVTIGLLVVPHRESSV